MFAGAIVGTPWKSIYTDRWLRKTCLFEKISIGIWKLVIYR
jgi:hypothetical protein